MDIQSLHSNIKYVGVFCSADDKIPEQYKQESFALGVALRKNNYPLVTGAGRTGLMNSVINGYTSLDEGMVKGVLPLIFKEYDISHPKLSNANLVWTDNIHQRLQSFQDLCDTMIILPGGFGTLHELMDFLVSKQFGLTNKKIILFNIDHFWDSLLNQFKIMVKKNALPQKHLDFLNITTSISDCLESLKMNENHNSGLTDRFWEAKTYNQKARS